MLRDIATVLVLACQYMIVQWPLVQCDHVTTCVAVPALTPHQCNTAAATLLWTLVSAQSRSLVVLLLLQLISIEFNI